jgi:lipopolysaccharide export system permease protein
MKIYFRYLFLRLFVPFVVCFSACALIWIMVDLYGNLDDFLEHKNNIGTILRFYSLQLPSMVVQVLPASLLFSTLWTIMALNRRSELVAFQSGGMAPIWLFSPFLLFAGIWMALLAFDLNWPAPRSLVTRERLLLQVKGQSAKNNVFSNLPYMDRVNRRIWFLQSLDINQGTAKGVEILERDDNGNDVRKYFAQQGAYVSGGFWRLSGVLEIIFNETGGVREQKTYEQLDLPDVTTPPKQLSLIVSQPEQLTLSQLSQYIATSPASKDNLAKFRTEWWYRVLYPLSLIVLMLFALLHGTRLDRRAAAAGVFATIMVLLTYTVVMNVFLAAGRYNRLPPFIAVIASEAIFGGIGLYLLAIKNGWGWQLLEVGKQWKAKWDEGREEASGDGEN